jgi:hypothetical protein
VLMGLLAELVGTLTMVLTVGGSGTSGWLLVADGILMLVALGVVVVMVGWSLLLSAVDVVSAGGVGAVAG